MANETLKYCDLGPAIIGREKFEELNSQTGGVGGASDLGPAFLSPPAPEPVVEPVFGGHDNLIEKAATKPAAKKRAR